MKPYLEEKLVSVSFWNRSRKPCQTDQWYFPVSQLRTQSQKLDLNNPVCLVILSAYSSTLFILLQEITCWHQIPFYLVTKSCGCELGSLIIVCSSSENAAAYAVSIGLDFLWMINLLNVSTLLRHNTTFLCVWHMHLSCFAHCLWHQQSCALSVDFCSLLSQCSALYPEMLCCTEIMVFL